MQLYRCRVGGHFVLKNTGWFTVSQTSTIISGKEGSGKSTLLRAIRSINPPFCYSDPAPFPAFPQYVRSELSVRKVMPAKKTAVIAIFPCDEPLRATLEQIDPVYLETDQIEVGRRLDNSRWFTFVDIASSSRWSELAAGMEKLRKLFPDTENAAEAAGLWRECAALAPTDRVKDGLADRLNSLLDYLDQQARRQEERELLHQSRFLVNRQARFRQAREATAEALPVFVYLHQDDLLSATINAEEVAEKIRRPEESPHHCADLFFLELLGVDHAFLRRADNAEIIRHLRENAAPYAEKSRRLNKQLMQHIAALCPSLALSAAAGTIGLRFDDGRNDATDQNMISLWHRWVLSCAVSIAYVQEFKGRELILLLDEPDTGLEPDEKTQMAAMLQELSETCQMIVCSTRADFLGNGGKRYRLEQESADIPGSVIY